MNHPCATCGCGAPPSPETESRVSSRHGLARPHVRAHAPLPLDSLALAVTGAGRSTPADTALPLSRKRAKRICCLGFFSSFLFGAPQQALHHITHKCVRVCLRARESSVFFVLSFFKGLRSTEAISRVLSPSHSFSSSFPFWRPCRLARASFSVDLGFMCVCICVYACVSCRVRG